MKTIIRPLPWLVTLLFISACHTPSPVKSPQLRPSVNPENIILLPDLVNSSGSPAPQPVDSSTPQSSPQPINTPNAQTPQEPSVFPSNLASLTLAPSQIILSQAGETYQLILKAKDTSGKELDPKSLILNWEVSDPKSFEIRTDGLLISKANSGFAVVKVSHPESGIQARISVTMGRSSFGGGGGGGTANATPTPPVQINHCSENSSCQISAIAGTGQSGDGGDFGSALNAQFDEPHGLVINNNGELFIADSFNHKIRRIDPTNTITTLAGLGLSGFNGEQGQAHLMRLDFPNSLAVDSLNNQVYFSDKVNNRVRRVDLNTGELITIAGGGNNGDGGLATDAELKFPLGIALYQNTLYIVDSLQNTVRAVDLNTGVITTAVGTGAFGDGGDGGPATNAELDFPHDIAIDAQGQMFIADSLNHKIRKVDLNTGIISTLAGNGSAGNSGDGGIATAAQLNSPRGIAVSPLGHVYIADTFNKTIRLINGQTGKISTVAGGGDGTGNQATSAQLTLPYDVFVDVQNDIYVVDSLDNRIKKISSSQ